MDKIHCNLSLKFEFPIFRPEPLRAVRDLSETQVQLSNTSSMCEADKVAWIRSLNKIVEIRYEYRVFHSFLLHRLLESGLGIFRSWNERKSLRNARTFNRSDYKNSPLTRVDEE